MPRLKYITALIVLLFLNFSFSQEFSQKKLYGVWQATEVTVNQKMFKEQEEDKIKLVESIFLNSKYSFSKSGLFKMELQEGLPEPFTDEMFGDVYYFSLSNNLISVGTRKKSGNIMAIQIVDADGPIYFNLVGVLCRVEKIAPSVKLKIDKQKLNERPKVLPSKPLLFQDLKEDDIVEFAALDEIPSTLECARIMDKDDLKKCVSTSFMRTVNRKFNTDLAGNLGLSGIIRMKVQFVLTKDKEVVNITCEAPHPELEKEAIRVTNFITVSTPAYKDGVAVNTKYSFPIIFQIVD